jgi:hypothetical protein
VVKGAGEISGLPKEAARNTPLRLDMTDEPTLTRYAQAFS